MPVLRLDPEPVEIVRIIDDDPRVEGASFQEVAERRGPAETGAHQVVLALEHGELGEIDSVDVAQDPLLRYLLKSDGGGAGEVAAYHEPAEAVLVMAAIAGQRHRDHEVVLIVPDEIQNDERLVRIVGPAESAAQLLHEDYGRLRRPEHQDLIDLGDVDAFVEHVADEDVVEDIAVIGAEASDGILPPPDGILPGEGDCPIAAGVHLLRQDPAFLLCAAEHQTLGPAPMGTVVLRLLDDVADALVAGQGVEVRIVIDGLPVDGDLGDAEVMERTEEPGLESAVEAYLVGDVVVEHPEDVGLVHPLGGGGHAEHEFRSEIAEDAAILPCGGMVGLVADDVIELVPREFVQPSADGLDGCEQCRAFLPLLRPGELAVGVTVSENPAVAVHRLLQDVLVMDDEQEPAGCERLDIECGDVRLPCSRRRDEKSAALAVLP